MKHLLLSTALVAMAAPALAQTAQPAAPAPTAPAATAPATTATTAMPTTEIFRGEPVTDAVYASEFIGSTLYVAENDVTEMELTEASDQWDSVGEVNDVVISRDGQVEAVLADVGGFLGMGERTVAVNMDAIRVVMDSDTPGDYFLVFTANREALETAPEYELPETMTTAAATPEAAAPAATATAPMATAPMATDTPAASPMEGYMPVDHAMLTAEQLEGVDVYDANNDSVGEISDLVLTADGKIDRAVVDVGGFLGIGAKPVALSLSDITVYKETDGDAYRASISMTKEQLEAMPGYRDS